jgi:large conductance mechanosensitive channel
MVTPPEHPESTIHNEVKEFVLDTGTVVKSKLQHFIFFIREQGVIGLAIGFLLSGSVSKTVSSFVDNVINPLIGLGLGKVNLADKMIVIGQATIKYGAFVSSIVDFIIIAAVIYFIFKGLGLDRLDKKKA